MRIEALRSRAAGGEAVVSATIVWEQRHRPPVDVFVATDDAYQSDLRANPHAFLVASALVAMEHRERRIHLEGPVSGELVDGIDHAMRVISGWYRDVVPIAIEADRVVDAPADDRAKRTAIFLSGGVDSLASLRHNHLAHGEDDADRIRDAIVVTSGFDDFNVDGPYRKSLQNIADAAGLTLVPVRTNFRTLEPSNSFFLNKYYGAFLAALAHPFSRRVSSVLIAAGYDEAHLHPHGSHPDLDPRYSAPALRIEHDLVEMSRYEKTALISDWPVAVANLRVCARSQGGPSGEPNCGSCEKCLRSLLAFTALGRSDIATTFPRTTVDASDVRAEYTLSGSSAPFAADLVDPLRAAGRSDLADAVDEQLAAYRRRNRSFTVVMKNAERTVLRGGLRRTMRRVRGWSPRPPS